MPLPINLVPGAMKTCVGQASYLLIVKSATSAFVGEFERLEIELFRLRRRIEGRGCPHD